MLLKRSKNCPRCGTFSLRIFLPRRPLVRSKPDYSNLVKRAEPAPCPTLLAGGGLLEMFERRITIYASPMLFGLVSAVPYGAGSPQGRKSCRERHLVSARLWPRATGDIEAGFGLTKMWPMQYFEISPYYRRHPAYRTHSPLRTG